MKLIGDSQPEYGKHEDDPERRRGRGGYPVTSRDASRGSYSRRINYVPRDYDEFVDLGRGKTRGRGRGKFARGQYRHGGYNYRNKSGITSIIIN
jgi:hypothetical protein